LPRSDGDVSSALGLLTNPSTRDTTPALASRHNGGIYHAKIPIQHRKSTARKNGIKPRIVVTPIASQPAIPPQASSKSTTDLTTDLATTLCCVELCESLSRPARFSWRSDAVKFRA